MSKLLKRFNQIKHLEKLNNILKIYNIYNRHFLINKKTNSITINCPNKENCYLMIYQNDLLDALDSGFYSDKINKNTCNQCYLHKKKRKKEKKHILYIMFVVFIMCAIF